MRPLEVFLQPVQDPQAQIVIIALALLALLDVLFGVINAMFIQHDFSSHEFRKGLIRKMSNFGIIVAADVVDGMLLGGLELGFQPVLMSVAISLALMELWSLLETFAEIHPEISNSAWYQMLLHSKDGLTKEERAAEQQQ
jgi:toxin secretion/phage lysis holin